MFLPNTSIGQGTWQLAEVTTLTKGLTPSGGLPPKSLYVMLSSLRLLSAPLVWYSVKIRLAR